MSPTWRKLSAGDPRSAASRALVLLPWTSPNLPARIDFLPFTLRGQTLESSNAGRAQGDFTRFFCSIGIGFVRLAPSSLSEKSRAGRCRRRFERRKLFDRQCLETSIPCSSCARTRWRVLLRTRSPVPWNRAGRPPPLGGDLGWPTRVHDGQPGRIGNSQASLCSARPANRPPSMAFAIAAVCLPGSIRGPRSAFESPAELTSRPCPRMAVPPNGWVGHGRSWRGSRRSRVRIASAWGHGAAKTSLPRRASNFRPMSRDVRHRASIARDVRLRPNRCCL
jgi:hypothetical protein